MVDVLREVVRACRAAGIEYCLIGGGCLGLVRHGGGFVPWDDDLDLAVFAADMPRFRSAMSALPPHLSVRPKSDAVHPSLMVMDTRTRTAGHGFEAETGVFIDVVPMMVWRSARWKRLDLALDRLRRIGWNAGSAPAMNRLKRVLAALRVPALAAWLGDGHFRRLAERHDREGRRAGRGVVTAAYRRVWVGAYDYATVFPLREAEFCGVAVAVPNDLHGFLRGRYGDGYMEIPPPGARWSHFASAVKVSAE